APKLPEALTSLGWVQLLNWDCVAAEKSLPQALQINPRYPQPHNFIGWLFSAQDQLADAALALARAHDLDPFSASTNRIFRSIARTSSERAASRSDSGYLCTIRFVMTLAFTSCAWDWVSAKMNEKWELPLAAPISFPS